MDSTLFQVPISPYCDPKKVKVTGAGLKGGKANKPAHFEIDARKAGEGGIGLTIEGPKEAEIKCDDHGDGTCSVEYVPEEDGEYYINVRFADEHVPGSPFKAIVSSDFDASKVSFTINSILLELLNVYLAKMEKVIEENSNFQSIRICGQGKQNWSKTFSATRKPL